MSGKSQTVLQIGSWGKVSVWSHSKIENQSHLSVKDFLIKGDELFINSPPLFFLVQRSWTVSFHKKLGSSLRKHLLPSHDIIAQLWSQGEIIFTSH